MQMREELAEFCDVYNNVVKGYQLLAQDYQQLNPDDKSMLQLAVDRMNTVASSEPMLDGAKQPMLNHTFQLTSYMSPDAAVKGNALTIAANSAYYIVLAGVTHQARAHHMAPGQQVNHALQEQELVPLQSEMYQPQNVAAFDEVLPREPVQFPLSFDDMSADGKALMKQFSHAWEHSQAQAKLQMDMMSAESLKESLRSLIQTLAHYRIASSDPIVTMFAWQLLPIQVQHLMAQSMWWRDLVATKAATPRVWHDGKRPRAGSLVHLLNSIHERYFPLAAADTLREELYFGVQQTRGEPHIGFIGRVIEMVDSAMDRRPEMWTNRDQNLAAELSRPDWRWAPSTA